MIKKNISKFIYQNKQSKFCLKLSLITNSLKNNCVVQMKHSVFPLLTWIQNWIFFVNIYSIRSNFNKTLIIFIKYICCNNRFGYIFDEV